MIFALLTAVPASAQTPLKIMVGDIDKQIYLPAKLVGLVAEGLLTALEKRLLTWRPEASALND
ncbi:hypothetical protein [Rhodopseudomonas parapalustris]